VRPNRPIAIRRRSRRTKGERNVVPFPPLSPVPRAPRFPTDKRQSSAARVIAVLADIAKTDMRLTGPNLTTGFHASGVDLGRLQTALARGTARLDLMQIANRWDEVRAWMHDVLRAWVQRYKALHIELRESGIRLEFETQDDHGYYSYGFDIFAGNEVERPRLAATPSSAT
jgi:hypothetical protein